MKKILKRGIALLLCFVMSMPMTAFASNENSKNKENQAENREEINVIEASTQALYTEEGSGVENENEGKPEGEDPEGDDPTDVEPEVEIPETADKAGWLQIADNWYYYDTDKTRAAGWRNIKGFWYFFDGNDEQHPGIMLQDTVCQVDGKYYAFNTKGAMLTGWVQRPEGWYFASVSGSFVTGWIKSKNKWYYLDGYNAEHVGLMVQNTNMLINGKHYGFDKKGAMLTGWVQRPEGWYFANPNGEFVMGWKKIGGKWYYFNANDEGYRGRMLADICVEIDGLPYSFLPSGAMKTGWDNENGDWYYYDTSSGQLISGWRKISGKWYYFEPDTKKMAPAGWHEINEEYYYMNAGGDMAIGWKKIGSFWYYLQNNGKMTVGWKTIDGFWYYFYMENDPHGGVHGAMASNTTIDGYKILPNGIYMTAVQERMLSRAQAYGSSTGYLILVDTTNCTFGVFTGSRGRWNMIKYWKCSPGAYSTPTVKGVFSVGAKGYYFDSGDLRLYWFTQFYGDYLIHSVCYMKDGRPADLRTGLHLSHGCVRLQIDNAKWVYDHVPGGSTVVCY